jgi:hypothetical protein
MKLSLFLTCMTFTALAQKATVNGYIKDAATGEVLIGATVLHKNSLQGTTANVHGFYSLTINVDSCTLIYSYVGYQAVQLKLRLGKDTVLNVNLASAGQLQEVVIDASRNDEIQELSKMSSITMNADQIKALPAFMGEVDVLKIVQLMPGVKSSEGSTGLYVRGGGPDQNLMLLDGVPVYNASHLFGFFSVFNADAISRVELMKGGFPARYGGRLSSVIDINMKDGNMKEFHGEGSVGIIAAKATLEGPILKDKTSFLVSARRTYLDAIVRPFIRANSNEDAGYYFYDLNAKVNHILDQKNRIHFSAYLGKDVAHASQRQQVKIFDETMRNVEYDAGLSWGNAITALRWNHVAGPRLFSNLTATYSKYRFGISSEYNGYSFSGQPEYNRAEYNSGIRDWSAKLDLDFIPSPDHYIRFGGQAIWHLFTPGVLQTQDMELDTTLGAKKTFANELSAYIEDDIRIGNKLKVNVGLHASGFLVEDRFYHSIQPRVSGRLLMGRDFSLKASYATMAQYIHLLTNAGLGLPTDLWVPSTARVRPQQARQVAIGVAKTYKSTYEFSLESYYKTMSSLIEYRDGASFVSIDDDWQDNVATGGVGQSYGAEFLAQKKAGNMTGWVGYTLSWTNRRFEELNNGNWYPYKYDRRHDVSVAMTHNWNKRMDFSAVWVFGTGNALTLPIAHYSGPYQPVPGQPFYYSDILYYGSRNAYRMRSYHRLDLSISFSKEKRWGERKWTFAVYNVYNRKNPFYMDIGIRDGNRVFIQYSLFPIIPSVAYSFKF